MFNIDELLHREDFWEETRMTFMQKWTTTMHTAVDIDLICKFKDELLDRVKSREFEWGVPRKIRITKTGTSKKRIVYLFDLEQRILLGVLYRVLGYYFQDKVSDSCFSYKKGVNTLKAVNHIRSLNTDCEMYGVKLDISAYFNSVSKARIDEMIEDVFKDRKDTDIYWLVRTLYDIDTVEDNGVQVKEFMSLIAGTAIASFFANLCLYDMDVYFESRGIPYARYSDDIVTFANTEEEIQVNLNMMKDKLEDYGLSINPRKYEYFNPHDDIDFLGLTFNKDKVDIHKFSFEKVKAKIRKDIKKGRKKIEEGKPYDVVASAIIHRFNHRTYKCYIEDKSKYGWGYYAFRYVNTDKTLREIDFYFRDRLRYLYTGRNNKANIGKVSDAKLHDLGYVSLVMMYKLFKTDFDAYCDYVSLLK